MSFQRAVQVLRDEGVEFIVIGGWSAILHGSAHVTNDLDIFYARSGQNLRKLAKALAPYHPRPRDLPAGMPFVWNEVTLRNSTILTLSTDLGMIDLLAEVAGLGTFEEVDKTASEVQAFERQIRTLDLESLIRSKKAAGREKDLRVLPELESLRETDES